MNGPKQVFDGTFHDFYPLTIFLESASFLFRKMK